MPLSKRGSQIDDQCREIFPYTDPLFPAACYDEDLLAEEIGWHWHDEWEVYLQFKGTAVVEIPGCSYTLLPGQGIFINAGTLHHIKAASSSAAACQGHIAVFHPRMIAGQDTSLWQKYIQPVLSAGIPAQPLWPEVAWHKEALSAFGWGWLACVKDVPGYEFELRQGAGRLIFLLSQQPRPAQAVWTERQRRNIRRVKDMMLFIQSHYSQNITLDEIAASIGISASEALRCYKNVINDTPVHYLQQYRVSMASKLLIATDLKIQVICEKCGFSESGYFTKVFRQTYGCTPGRWRKERRIVP